MLSRILSFWSAIARRRRMEAGMDEELRFHLQSHAERLMASGVPEKEALRRARLEFGSLDAAKETCREAKGLYWPEELVRNVRFAFRMLRRNPAFAATAILTLGLGIGANTAIFSVIDAVLLRPLPYPEPERLVRVVTEFRNDGTVDGSSNAQDGAAWEILSAANTEVDFGAVGFGGAMAVASEGRAEYFPVQRVTAGYFRVLGVRLALGRDILPEEDVPNGPAVAVISDAIWSRYFQRAADVIGRSITVRGEPHTVVGVAPPGFLNFQSGELWTPLRVTRSGEGSGTNYLMIGRIGAGISLEQARQQVEAAGRAVIEARKTPADARARMQLVPLQEGLVGVDRTPLLAIWGAVGLVLVIACVNVAGLLLARSETRAREVATREALGGGRGAVVRQLLTESLVLAGMGGVAGLGFGYLGIRLLSAWGAEELGIWQNFGLDYRVLSLAFGASLLTGLLFGLLPAFQTVSVNIRDALSVGGARGAAGGRTQWPRRVLVSAEVAIGLVLLIGAGLLIRSFYNVYNLPPGFDATNVISTSVSMNDARYAEASLVNQYFERTLEGVRAVPGVESVAVGLHVPFDRWLNTGVRVPGIKIGNDDYMMTTLNYVTPGFLEILRIPVKAGRTFRESDNEAGGKVAIINETFARRYFGGENPLGRELVLGGDKAAWRIVGLVGDVQQTPGLTGGAPFAPEPGMYVPARQLTGWMSVVHTWFSPKWVIRGRANPAALVPQLQRAFADVDPLLPTREFRRIESFRGERLSFERTQLVLLGIMAALALLLGAVGIYGLVSQTVIERTREIGIRIVMGASTAAAMWNIVLPTVALTAAGLAAGIGLASLATRYLESRIYGVTPLDPITFAAAAVFLLGIAALASLIPALRLTRLNPAQTLRAE